MTRRPPAARYVSRRSGRPSTRHAVGHTPASSLLPLAIAAASGVAVALVMVLIVIVGMARADVGAAGPGDADAPSPSASSTPSARPKRPISPKPITPTPVEGEDYQFLEKVHGSPVRWPCGASIRVRVVGSMPAGTQESLKSVVAMLRNASGLDLVVAAPGEDSAPQYSTNVITVYFRSHGEQVGPLRLSPSSTLGQGGPRWDASGTIDSGSVLIRDDTPMTDPNTQHGRHVIMHELGHALALGHSKQTEAELMAPESGADSTPTLGPGDREALKRVGCSR